MQPEGNAKHIILLLVHMHCVILRALCVHRSKGEEEMAERGIDGGGNYAIK